MIEWGYLLILNAGLLIVSTLAVVYYFFRDFRD